MRRRKLLSVILALSLCLTLPLGMAAAEEPAGTATEVKTSEALTTALADSAVETVRLGTNIEISASLAVSRTVTLDLNGCVLKMTGDGSVIYVADKGHLKLTDSTPTAEHKFTPDENGLWALDETNGTKTVKGGVITGGTGSHSGIDAYGGGVYVANGGEFTMCGGSITGCAAVGASFSFGGGIHNEGTTRLSGRAEIRDCHAKAGTDSYASGGGVSDTNGVLLDISGNVKITGCTIDGKNEVRSDAMNIGYHGNISGGTFDGSVENNGKISGGTFNGKVTNSRTITEGTFNGAVTNEGSITGGTFNGGVTNGENGTISGATVVAKVSTDTEFLEALAKPYVTTIKLMGDEIRVNKAEAVEELTVDRAITLVNDSRAPNLYLWLPLTIAEGGALTLEGGVFFYPCDSVTVNGSLTVGAGCEVIFEVDQSFLTINQGGTVTTQPAGKNTISGLLSLSKDAALTVNGALVNNGRLSVSNMENLKKAASIGGDLILDDITITEDYTLDMKDCTLTIGHITFLNANLTVKNASRVDATGVTISGGSYYCPVTVGNAEGVITGGSFYGPVTVKKISDGTPAYIYGGTFYAELKGSYITKGCKVTFMNGSSQYAMQVVKDKASAPDTPVKSGYTFGGWYKDSTLQTPWDFANDTVTTDTTLYAKWTANPPAPSYDDSDPTYAVSAPAAENGSVTVSPKSASAGSTVTITVKPDSGYVLETISVTDKNGNDLKLTDKGNGKYTFTMPTSKVEIKVTFMEDNSVLNFFYDVPNDAYYYEAVKWAAENGITGGVGNSLFAPNQPCTRGQIVTFLWRAAGSPEPKNMSNFSDVPADSYYAKAVAWAVENGITTGTGDGKFSPDATCTRAQSVTFLFRASKASANGAPAFSDVAATAYYAEAVKWATDNGITNGIGDNLFGSDNDCTRAQIVTFLYRMYQEN